MLWLQLRINKPSFSVARARPPASGSGVTCWACLPALARWQRRLGSDHGSPCKTRRRHAASEGRAPALRWLLLAGPRAGCCDCCPGWRRAQAHFRHQPGRTLDSAGCPIAAQHTETQTHALSSTCSQPAPTPTPTPTRIHRLQSPSALPHPKQTPCRSRRRPSTRFLSSTKRYVPARPSLPGPRSQSRHAAQPAPPSPPRARSSSRLTRTPACSCPSTRPWSTSRSRPMCPRSTPSSASVPSTSS